MALVQQVRRKGYEVMLEDMAIVLMVPPGVDVDAAKTWALKHEQELRRELVSEIQRVALLREVFPGAKLVQVKGTNGKPISGQVTVRVADEVKGVR